MARKRAELRAQKAQAASDPAGSDSAAAELHPQAVSDPAESAAAELLPAAAPDGSRCDRSATKNYLAYLIDLVESQVPAL